MKKFQAKFRTKYITTKSGQAKIRVFFQGTRYKTFNYDYELSAKENHFEALKKVTDANIELIENTGDIYKFLGTWEI